MSPNHYGRDLYHLLTTPEISNADLPDAIPSLGYYHDYGKDGPMEMAKNASMYLNSLGIAGNKFVDARSRDEYKNALDNWHSWNMNHQMGQNDLAYIAKTKGIYHPDYTNMSLQLDRFPPEIAKAKAEFEAQEAASTRNYVVFNDNDLHITHWNNRPVQELGPASGAQ